MRERKVAKAEEDRKKAEEEALKLATATEEDSKKINEQVNQIQIALEVSTKEDK